jgi:peptidoglycan/LPS O-acetylase OafA/YrhL
MQNKKIEFANTLRGFAAVCVVISHYYGVFWSSRGAVEALTNSPALSLEAHPIPTYISLLHVFQLFNWGSYGVALFFIVSGFVIPFSLQRMGWFIFSVNRVLRIMPTYFVGFSVTLLAIFLSGKYFVREWPFGLEEVLIHYIPGLRDLMWSRGIDGIVWTLEIEMKFYLLCAILIGLFRQQSLKVFVAPVMLFVFAIGLNNIIPVWANSNASAWRLAMVYMMVSQYII